MGVDGRGDETSRRRSSVLTLHGGVGCGEDVKGEDEGAEEIHVLEPVRPEDQGELAEVTRGEDQVNQLPGAGRQAGSRVDFWEDQVNQLQRGGRVRGVVDISLGWSGTVARSICP